MIAELPNSCKLSITLLQFVEKLRNQSGWLADLKCETFKRWWAPQKSIFHQMYTVSSFNQQFKQYAFRNLDSFFIFLFIEDNEWENAIKQNEKKNQCSHLGRVNFFILVCASCTQHSQMVPKCYKITENILVIMQNVWMMRACVVQSRKKNEKKKNTWLWHSVRNHFGNYIFST